MSGVLTAPVTPHFRVMNQLSFPCGLMYDRDGNWLVVDRGNNRIQQISRTGQFIMTFGAGGELDGKLRNPFISYAFYSSTVWTHSLTLLTFWKTEVQRHERSFARNRHPTLLRAECVSFDQFVSIVVTWALVYKLIGRWIVTIYL